MSLPQHNLCLLLFGGKLIWYVEVFSELFVLQELSIDRYILLIFVMLSVMQVLFSVSPMIYCGELCPELIRVSCVVFITIVCGVFS